MRRARTFQYLVDERVQKCDRAGNYSLARLISDPGPEQGLPELLAYISRNCPKRAGQGIAARCFASTWSRAGSPRFRLADRAGLVSGFVQGRPEYPLAGQVFYMLRCFLTTIA